ncbi:MAG: glutaredoxin family protein [Egibacteraceae bacterium]
MEAKSPESALTVYWRPMCGYCAILKRALDDRGIAYDDVDIWTHRDQAEVVRRANGGDELVPTVRIGETFMANPSVDEVLAVLDAA